MRVILFALTGVLAVGCQATCQTQCGCCPSPACNQCGPKYLPTPNLVSQLQRVNWNPGQSDCGCTPANLPPCAACNAAAPTLPQPSSCGCGNKKLFNSSVTFADGDMLIRVEPVAQQTPPAMLPPVKLPASSEHTLMGVLTFNSQSNLWRLSSPNAAGDSGVVLRGLEPIAANLKNGMTVAVHGEMIQAPNQSSSADFAVHKLDVFEQ